MNVSTTHAFVLLLNHQNIPANGETDLLLGWPAQCPTYLIFIFTPADWKHVAALCALNLRALYRLDVAAPSKSLHLSFMVHLQENMVYNSHDVT